MTGDLARSCHIGGAGVRVVIPGNEGMANANSGPTTHPRTGHLQIVPALTVGEAGQITAIDVIADPDRLGRLHLAALPD